MVDEKDFQILAQLARDLFSSNEEIGRALGLSGASVKRRVEGLIAEGVLPSTWLLPVPQVFGRHARVFVYKDVPQPSDSVAAVLSIDPIVWAGFDIDGTFHVQAFTESPDAAPPESLVSLLGPPVFAVSPPASHASAAEAALSRLDLRVLRVLIRRPRALIKEIATETGLSPKTVRRHRDAMFARGLFMLFPVLHVARSRGLVLYNAFVQGSDVPSNAQRILATLPRCRLCTARTSTPGLWLICWAESMAEVSDVEGRLRTLPGVERVGVVMRLRVDFALERVEGWIQEELAKWETARLRTARVAGRPDP